MSGAEVVYIFSSSAGSKGIISSRYNSSSFSMIWGQTDHQVDNSVSDGAYGMYLDFGTIASGASVTRQAVYAAGPVSAIKEICSAASSAL